MAGSSSNNVSGRHRSFIRRLWQAFRKGLADWQFSVVFAFLWGAAMAGCAMLSLYANGWQNSGRYLDLAILYFSGGLAGGFSAWSLAEGSRTPRPGTARLAIFLTALTGLTIGLTALIFAIDFRISNVSTDAPATSIHFYIQLTFTTLGALYYFAVGGVRLLLPTALLPLLAAALVFIRRNR